MPNIAPFQAIHYPWDADFDELTAPPYDVISPTEAEGLRTSDDHNVIRVSVGGDYSNESQAKYDQAALSLRQWLGSGVLVKDDDALFYAYSMEYQVEAEMRTTAGLLAALTLEPFGTGGIHPHERTIPGPIKDRFELMKTTKANLEPLWFFASSRLDGFGALMESTLEAPPLAQVSKAGVRHRIWALQPDKVADVAAGAGETPFVIADGHHRYETALAYRELMRQESGPGPWDETLALIVDPVDFPPLLAPIHRIVTEMDTQSLMSLAASQGIELAPFEGDLPALVAEVTQRGPGHIGVAAQDASWVMAAQGDLDTTFLNDKILEPLGAEVTYEHDAGEIAATVNAGSEAFILAAAPIDLVAKKAEAGDRMPPKTTLFWPKPRTGFVMRDLTK
ncbi:MAG: DUF1015 family protein [Actinomycetota bacterium]